MFGGDFKEGGGASIGVANSTVVAHNETKAYADKGVTIQAGGNQGDVVVFTGQFDGDRNQETESLRGLAVTATSLDEITTIAAAGSTVGKEQAGVAGSATVSVLNETTHAYIGKGVSVNAADSGENTGQSAP